MKKAIPNIRSSNGENNLQKGAIFVNLKFLFGKKNT
jgi:hypothetical protein